MISWMRRWRPSVTARAGLAGCSIEDWSCDASVGIYDGVIVVTFGNEANAAISGETLTLTPYETLSLNIVWRCGWAPKPAGLSPMGASGGGRTAAFIPSTVADVYLPSACKP